MATPAIAVANSSSTDFLNGSIAPSTALLTKVGSIWKTISTPPSSNRSTLRWSTSDIVLSEFSADQFHRVVQPTGQQPRRRVAIDALSLVVELERPLFLAELIEIVRPPSGP
ncbi:hypothetical protein C478_06526 [Natrinema thermotolerans DSM 11552]|nr:hypothetical protein C478_06526 [Natrinema thermotolerans DSM 11552]